MNFMNFLASGVNLLNFSLSGADRLTNNFFQSAPNSASNESKKKEGWQEVIPKSAIAQPVTPQSEENPLHSQVQISTGVMSKQKIIQQMLLKQQEELMNQYYQLNMQLLNKKLEVQKQKEKPKVQENQSDDVTKTLKKKIKKMNKCGHQDKEHYAKGMCNNCYHKYGRTKKPWNCDHQKLYAAGLCQNCYINKYNKDKRNKEAVDKTEQKIESESEMPEQPNL